MIKYFDLQKINARHHLDFMKAFERVNRSGQYLLGAEVSAFEKEFADYCGAKYCVGTGNGLDALTIILQAYMEMDIIQEDDEILVPANTYIATLLAITRNHLKPVLIEPKIDTFTINPDLLESYLTIKTKAIMPVHLYGRCAEMDAIREFARKYHIIIIEDAAQAHGAYYKQRNNKAGNLGDVAAFSFYPAKNMGALGDGGAITTNNADLAEFARTIANYGSLQKYVHLYKGFNSRLDEIQAALLRIKLKTLDKDNFHRRQIAKFYREHIQHPEVRLPNYSDENVFHIYPVLCSRRDALKQHLLDRGIETMVHYPIPPHKQKAFSEWNSLSYPTTEMICREELSLPMSQVLSYDDAGYIADAINDFK